MKVYKGTDTSRRNEWLAAEKVKLQQEEGSSTLSKCRE